MSEGRFCNPLQKNFPDFWGFNTLANPVCSPESHPTLRPGESWVLLPISLNVVITQVRTVCWTFMITLVSLERFCKNSLLKKKDIICLSTVLSSYENLWYFCYSTLCTTTELVLQSSPSLHHAHIPLALQLRHWHLLLANYSNTCRCIFTFIILYLSEDNIWREQLACRMSN